MTDKTLPAVPQDEDTSPPEFSSVIVTIDPVSGEQGSGQHHVQKFVASTQTLTETMLALLAYYDEEHLLKSAATLGQFQLLPSTELPCFVYRTPRNVEIVMDQATFNALCFANGSVLQASKFIADAAGRAIVDTEAHAGGAVPLILFSFSVEDPDAS